MSGASIDIMVLNLCEGKQECAIKIGILFKETLGGYCCGEDEPMESNGYSEVLVKIDRATAIGNIELVS